MDYIEQSKRLSKKSKDFSSNANGRCKKTWAIMNLAEWINFCPSTTIEEGVVKFVDWYCDFYNTLDSACWLL